MNGVDAETRALLTRVGYMETAIQHAVGFVIRGPSWLPSPVRRVPLAACCLILRFELWRLRKAPKVGGMGAVAPMVTRRRPPRGVWRVAEPSHTGHDVPRFDQQKETPASAGTTPGAMTNIGDNNADRADCRS